MENLKNGNNKKQRNYGNIREFIERGKIVVFLRMLMVNTVELVDIILEITKNLK